MKTRNAMAGQTRLKRGQPPNVQVIQATAGRRVAVSVHCEFRSYAMALTARTTRRPTQPHQCAETTVGDDLAGPMPGSTSRSSTARVESTFGDDLAMVGN